MAFSRTSYVLQQPLKNNTRHLPSTTVCMKPHEDKQMCHSNLVSRWPGAVLIPLRRRSAHRPSICQSTCRCVYRSFNYFIFLSIHLFIYLSMYIISIYICLHLSIYLSLSICLSICVSIYLSVYLSIYHYVDTNTYVYTHTHVQVCA